MIMEDLQKHKDEWVPHTLVVTGPDPVPLEMCGLSEGSSTGLLIPRHDLKTNQEADTIIVQQVNSSVIY